MKTIWKYVLDITDMQDIGVPLNAEILCVQIQNDQPCIWVKVDPNLPKVTRTILTCTECQNIPNSPMKYIGTYQLKLSTLLLHVFEVINEHL